MVRSSSNEVRHAAVGGVFAGLIAGTTLTVMMIVMTLARGTDPWYGVKGAAAPIFGQRAMEAGYDLLPVVLGFAIHLAISVAWAVPFALLVFGLGRALTVVAGAAWGIVVWLGMYYVVLPLVGLGAMVHDAPVSRAVGYHVFFGLAVGIAFLRWQREARALRAAGAV
ncbi:MAG TPA: hypothetical protein VM925_00990 [Labilithrix sp.]|nr:hypothetical protein [Labilithrix sp.]